MTKFIIAIFVLTQFTLPCHAGNTNIFLEAGIPTADREWFGFDYKLTADTFVSGKVGLPRFSDKDGACLLDRITSTDNFSFYLNKTIPLKSRMEDFFMLFESANSISKLYFKDANKGEKVHKEIAHMLAFILQAADIQMDLADEFLPTIPKDDKYATRMDGLNKMNSGLMTVFVGAENTLSEQKNYSTDDLSTILGAMANTLPHLKTAFSSGYRVELQKKLEAHKSEFKGPGDLRRIDQMFAELSK